MTRCLRPAAVVALLLSAAALQAQNDVDRNAVDRTHRFLYTVQRSKFVLGYVHAGMDYKGVKAVEARRLGSGAFSLVYEYQWGDGGATTLAFDCDARGSIY